MATYCCEKPFYSRLNSIFVNTEGIAILSRLLLWNFQSGHFFDNAARLE
jgi:hypothetical protein